MAWRYRERDKAQPLDLIADLASTIGETINTQSALEIERSRIQSQEQMTNARTALDMLQIQSAEARDIRNKKIEQLNRMEDKYGEFIDFSEANKGVFDSLSQGGSKVVNYAGMGLENTLKSYRNDVEAATATTKMFDNVMGKIQDDISFYNRVQDPYIESIADSFRRSSVGGNDYEWEPEEIDAMWADEDFQKFAKKLDFKRGSERERIFMNWLRTGVKDKQESDMMMAQIEQAKAETNAALKRSNLTDLEMQITLANSSAKLSEQAYVAADRMATKQIENINIGGVNVANYPEANIKSAAKKQLEAIGYNKKLLKDPTISGFVKLSFNTMQNTGSSDALITLWDSAEKLMTYKQLDAEGKPVFDEQGRPIFPYAEFVQKWMGSIGMDMKSGIVRGRVIETQKFDKLGTEELKNSMSILSKVGEDQRLAGTDGTATEVVPTGTPTEVTTQIDDTIYTKITPSQHTVIKEMYEVAVDLMPEIYDGSEENYKEYAINVMKSGKNWGGSGGGEDLPPGADKELVEGLENDDNIIQTLQDVNGGNGGGWFDPGEEEEKEPDPYLYSNWEPKEYDTPYGKVTQPYPTLRQKISEGGSWIKPFEESAVLYEEPVTFRAYKKELHDLSQFIKYNGTQAQKEKWMDREKNILDSLRILAKSKQGREKTKILRYVTDVEDWINSGRY